MRKWLGHFFIKLAMLFSCYIGVINSYICSLALYHLADTKVLVIGDYHHYCKDDLEHRFQLHDFFENIKRKNKQASVIIEGNYTSIAKLNTLLNSELLLPTTWLYGYGCTESNLVFHFADPRIELHKLYRDFSRGNLNAYSIVYFDILFQEYHRSIEEFRAYKTVISEENIKLMLELVSLRVKRGLKSIKEYSIAKDTIQNNQLLELKEAIMQSYLDIADMSFCLKLHQLLNDTKAIIVLVGYDHTIRMNYMLQSLGYKTTQVISESCHDSALLKPVTLSEISSYFSAFFA